MEKYNNEDYLKKEIMGQSRHLFIYGYNNEYRSKFLKSLEDDFPIIAGSDKPVALYFDSLGLPKEKVDSSNIDYDLIRNISMEHLSFEIATNILEKSVEFDEIDSKLCRLIELTNIGRNKGYNEIKTVKDLLIQMKTTRDFYCESYLNCINGKIDRVSIDKVAIPFLQLELFVRNYKRAMKMNSYFGIVFDKKSPFATSSIRAINNLIGARINSDISVKVAIEPNDWETYYDMNNQFVEAIHDYGTVELDSAYGDDMLKLTKNFYD